MHTIVIRIPVPKADHIITHGYQIGRRKHCAVGYLAQHTDAVKWRPMPGPGGGIDRNLEARVARRCGVPQPRITRLRQENDRCGGPGCRMDEKNRALTPYSLLHEFIEAAPGVEWDEDLEE